MNEFDSIMRKLNKSELRCFSKLINAIESARKSSNSKEYDEALTDLWDYLLKLRNLHRITLEDVQIIDNVFFEVTVDTNTEADLFELPICKE